jgi:hypothetical protein
MIKTEYMKSNGKVYEVIDKSGKYPVCKLTNLTEIPEDKPLEKPVVEEKPEEDKPKRGRKAK